MRAPRPKERTRRRAACAVSLAVALVWTAAAAGPVGAAAAAAPRGATDPGRPLSAEALAEVAGRLAAFGSRAVGDEGRGPAASYVGGRFLLAGLKPVLTDTFTCPLPADGAGAAAPDRRSSETAVCGSVVAFGHALPLADAWSLMKGEAEAFTFDRTPRPDLEAALRQAAEAEGVSRLEPFDVFKRPSPLFPEAVVRCLLRRLVRAEAGAGADHPAARAIVSARMLRRLARAHEAVLLAAPLDVRPAAGTHRADESASLAALCALARHLVCESPRPRTRTVICAALDGHWCGAAGARSLARMLASGDARADGVPRGGSPDPPRAGADTDDRAAGAETRRASEESGVETAEDAQLAALLGPSEAAARAPALAEALEARPADAALAAEAEDVLVRLLRLEPYGVRLAVFLDLSDGGRRVTVHLAGAGGEEGAAFRQWLAEAVVRAQERCGMPFSAEASRAPDAVSLPETASGRAQAALASADRPAVLLRTADAGPSRRAASAEAEGRGGAAALAEQARAVAALLEEILAADDLPHTARHQE